MTVKELMKALEKMNPDATVTVDAPYDYGYGMAGGDILVVKADKDGNVYIETEMA